MNAVSVRFRVMDAAATILSVICIQGGGGTVDISTSRHVCARR